MRRFFDHFCIGFAVALSLPKHAMASIPDDPAQQAPMAAFPSTEHLKVPGESPAYYCSDPSDDIVQINRLDFLPTNPRVGFYQSVRLIGHFISATGEMPYLNITATINGRPELSPLYDAPLCDIDVFQDVRMPLPGGDKETDLGMHRSCPPSIREGYAEISSPLMPLYPGTVPTGKWEVRAEAQTQDRRRIFCVEASFDMTI